MKIENRINPFCDSAALLVTTSGTKRDIARQWGIGVETDPQKQIHVAKGEEDHDVRNNNGVLIVSQSGEDPYSLSVARAKAKQLIGQFSPNGHSHIVTDSTWVICKPDGKKVAINKPIQDTKRKKKILDCYQNCVGMPMSSDTGIAVINSKGDIEEYYASIIFGVVRDTIDSARLWSVFDSNSDASGGLSCFDALSHVIKPFRYSTYTLNHVGKSGMRPILGGIVRSKSVAFVLNTDATNNPAFRAMSLGIIR